MNIEMLAYHELIDMEKHYQSLVDSGSIKDFSITNVEIVTDPSRVVDDILVNGFPAHTPERVVSDWRVSIQPQAVCKHVSISVNRAVMGQLT